MNNEYSLEVSARGLHIDFPNGITISVQIGPGTYCDNYHAPIMNDRKDHYVSKTAEIAIIYDRELLSINGWGDNVKGYVPIGEVLDIIEQYRKLDADGVKALKEASDREKMARQDYYDRLMEGGE